LTKISIPPGRKDGFASVAIGKDGTCIVNAAASANGVTTQGLRFPLRGETLEPGSSRGGSVEVLVHGLTWGPAAGF